MIVRDAGAAWQVVLQTDHAGLSGALARAWATPGARHDSVQVAAARHDDGWAVWERAPRLEAGSGKPVNFLDVDVGSHLAFYRACIAAVGEQDPYAGLLVSMHGAGIYRQRYGRDPALGLSRAAEAHELVDAFVAEQESGYERRMAETGASDEERWADYELVQLFDRLSLHFCLRDPEAGQAAEYQGYRVEPLGPWRVAITPYPFRDGEQRFSLVRRLVPKGTRAGVLEVAPAREAISIEPA